MNRSSRSSWKPRAFAWWFVVASVSLLPLLACGERDGGRAAPDGKIATANTEPLPSANSFLVTVVSAELDGKKPGGDGWDSSESSDSLAGLIAAGAMLYFTGSGTLAGLAANSASEPASKGQAVAPDPFVRFSFGQNKNWTDIKVDTCLPCWQSPLVIRGCTPTELMTITVVDADAGPAARTESRPDALSFRDDPMGTVSLPAAEVLKPGLNKLGPFGAVRQLVYQVEPYRQLTTKHQVVVPGDKAWTDTGITLIPGQVVHTVATGTITVSNDRDSSTGPAGFPLPRWKEFNVVHDAPHGGLLVRIGAGQPRFAGSACEQTVVGAGRLLFGPNDGDLWNNKGSFKVDIEIR